MLGKKNLLWLLASEIQKKKKKYSNLNNIRQKKFGHHVKELFQAMTLFKNPQKVFSSIVTL